MNKIIACLLITSLISACGWHLRGSTNLPANIDSIFVTAEDAHGALITEVRQLLKANNVTAATEASAAPYSLVIVEERDDRRTAGVGSDALTSAYQIILSVDYEIRNREGALLAPMTTATNARTYDYSAGNASSAAQEEALLLREMRRDIAQQMLRRLQAVSLNAPATASETTNGQAAP